MFPITYYVLLKQMLYISLVTGGNSSQDSTKYVYFQISWSVCQENINRFFHLYRICMILKNLRRQPTVLWNAVCTSIWIVACNKCWSVEFTNWLCPHTYSYYFIWEVTLCSARPYTFLPPLLTLFSPIVEVQVSELY